MSTQLTKQYLSIKAKEPYITEIMCSMAKAFRVELSGLEYRLKSWRSAIEKATVRTNINDFFKLADMVRYTMVLPEESYGKLANRILDACEGYGVHVESLINYWNNPNSGYNGVNVQLFCKGLHCELQFHTTDSLRVKMEESHPLYERLRSLRADSPEALTLQEELLRIGRLQKRPGGCESVCWETEERIKVVAK